MNGEDLCKVTRGPQKGVEVNGGVIGGLVATVTMPDARDRIVTDILKRHGIQSGTVDPNAWYPFAILEQMFALLQDNGLHGILRQFGKNTIDAIAWPPHVNSFEAAFCSIDTAYHMHHRRNGKPLFEPATGSIIEGNIGHCVLVPLVPGQRRAVYFCGSYYPEEFDIGMAQTIARKFKPDGALAVRITPDDSRPRKRRGGTSTTYQIEW